MLALVGVTAFYVVATELTKQVLSRRILAET
jgi:hypothetical protein